MVPAQRPSNEDFNEFQGQEVQVRISKISSNRPVQVLGHNNFTKFRNMVEMKSGLITKKLSMIYELLIPFS